jgi:C4-type Zn-finger protein
VLAAFANEKGAVQRRDDMKTSYLVKFRFFCPKCGALNAKLRTLVCDAAQPHGNKNVEFVKLACTSCSNKVTEVALEEAEVGAIPLDMELEVAR